MYNRVPRIQKLLVRLLVVALWVFVIPTLSAAPSATPATSPNIVLIFADDLGYADIGPFGATAYKTPNLDRLAREGRRFTSFYTAQPVCSASRAALLTGCYPNRIGIMGALGPKSMVGIHSNEVTLAELVKQKNYATAIFGKWHLGHHPQFLPLRHGFDEYYGLPYSNDMWPNHPEAKKGTYPDLPLIDGDRTIALNPDQTQLTKDYTARATRFIARNKERPFFLYLAHSMPHVPLFASDRFRDQSGAGLYGDVIQEIDWSVGEVLKALEENGLSQNTLVIFTSDNGPWLSYGNHSGSAGKLREGKGTVWEGGVRIPCVMRWPGKIPANTVCTEPSMTIDIFPTVAHITGATLPRHKIDGKNIWPLIDGTPGATSPQQAYFFYYNTNDLLAVRSGPWKLYVPQPYRSLNGRPGGTNGIPAKYENLETDLALYNLESDPSETKNLASAERESGKRLEFLLTQMRRDLGDALSNTQPAAARQPGRITEE
jgi:arylsulfatase A